MAKISQEQYKTMIARGMTPESITAIAKQKGYELPDGKGLLKKATETVNAIFPGGKIGEAIGTGIAKLKAKPEERQFITGPSTSEVLGDVAQSALTIAGPKIGTGAKVLSRIGANLALGSGLGASGSLARGESTKDVIKNTVLGGAISGALSGTGELIKATTQALPKWLVKAAIPKLDSKNIPYALENTKIGSIKTLAKNSNKAINTYEDTIQGLLNKPKNQQTIGGTTKILGDAMENFKESEYVVDDLVKNAKEIAPNVGKLITKFENGTANLGEINTIRKELDKATQSVYTSLSRPPEKKILGAALSNSMRNFVKTIEPETIPVFDNYSKEIGLFKALNAAIKKGEQKVRMGDLAAGTIGFYQGGFDGAIKAIIAERLLLNPSAQIIGAKALQTSSSKIAPVTNALLQGGKSTLINKITGQ